MQSLKAEKKEGKKKRKKKGEKKNIGNLPKLGMIICLNKKKKKKTKNKINSKKTYKRKVGRNINPSSSISTNFLPPKKQPLEHTYMLQDAIPIPRNLRLPQTPSTTISP